ncbi:MAG: site-specific DNA-methyltransferase [Thermodesulfobacteriota bacterium]
MIWDAKCGSSHEHEWGYETTSMVENATTAGLHLNRADSHLQKRFTFKGRTDAVRKSSVACAFCRICGAWKGKLGLEPTPGLYIKHLCSVFEEVKRVLRERGTCWVVMGDTYSGSTGVGWKESKWEALYTGQQSMKQKLDMRDDAPQKSLLQIPSRFAIEMASRGWLVRNEIVWFKPNALPSSARDRFTVDFERVFFLTKSRDYYFEQQLEPDTERPSGNKDRRVYGQGENGRMNNHMGESVPWKPTGLGRNKRCVWRIPTQPFPGAHFAVFPQALVETPIKAGCPEEVCTRCGRPREKVYSTRQEFRKWDREYWHRFLVGKSHSNWRYRKALEVMERWMTQYNCFDYAAFYTWWKEQMQGKWKSGSLEKGQASRLEGSLPFPRPEKRLRREVAGYSSCSCHAGFRPGIVLDPFAGSGTACLVARKLGRDFIGVDASKAYCRLARIRLKGSSRGGTGLGTKRLALS